tara:strand:- start:86 stop:820 length:735 start_codon:yes stop_codon:yes gene_type:complete
MSICDGNLICIEFIGLPSSGKTRFYNTLLEDLDQKGKSAYSFRNLYRDLNSTYSYNFRKKNPKFTVWYYFFKFFLKYPKYFLDVLKKILSLKPSTLSIKLTLLRFFIREGASWRFYTGSKRNGFYISDEGFLHRLISYGYSKKLEQKVIKSYIDKCPPSDIVVFLKHTVNDVQSRRSYMSDYFCKLFNITNEAKRIAELESMSNNLQAIALNLESRDLKLIELDNKTTEKQFLDLFYNTLKEIK